MHRATSVEGLRVSLRVYRECRSLARRFRLAVVDQYGRLASGAIGYGAYLVGGWLRLSRLVAGGIGPIDQFAPKAKHVTLGPDLSLRLRLLGRSSGDVGIARGSDRAVACAGGGQHPLDLCLFGRPLRDVHGPVRQHRHPVQVKLAAIALDWPAYGQRRL